jgi:hypothetical protein
MGFNDAARAAAQAWRGQPQPQYRPQPPPPPPQQQPYQPPQYQHQYPPPQPQSQPPPQPTRFDIPSSGRCPNCGAALNGPHCEYCRWTAPVMAQQAPPPPQVVVVQAPPTIVVQAPVAPPARGARCPTCHVRDSVQTHPPSVLGTRYWACHRCYRRFRTG